MQVTLIMEPVSSLPHSLRRHTSANLRGNPSTEGRAVPDFDRKLEPLVVIAQLQRKAWGSKNPFASAKLPSMKKRGAPFHRQCSTFSVR